jgi:hypothetical protein
MDSLCRLEISAMVILSSFQDKIRTLSSFLTFLLAGEPPNPLTP